MSWFKIVLSATISLLFFVAMAVRSMDWLLIVLIVFAAGMVWNYKDESP